MSKLQSIGLGACRRTVIVVMIMCGVIGVKPCQGELDAPVAAAATGVTPEGFTMNWTDVPGATGYVVDVYRYDGCPPTLTREGFDGYPATLADGWTVVNAGGVYTGAGNYGEAPPSVKLEADGHAVVTPLCVSPITNVAFWCKGFGVSNSFLSVEAHNGLDWVPVESVTVSNTAQVLCYFWPSNLGYVRVRLLYDKTLGNVGVDDVSLAYGDAARSYVLSNLAAGAATTLAVTNLIPGVYWYVVRATDSMEVSSDSNEIRVDTEALPQPPCIAPLDPRRVRVAETLEAMLAIDATDGDPVTSTNATASSGVSGTWGLSAGLFRYVPAVPDEGERVFTFTAADKDGVCQPVAMTVTVSRARTVAVTIDAPSGCYVQDFNTLSSNGVDVAWDDAADPLPAWYACVNEGGVTNYRWGTGSLAVGGLYSFGASDAPDRSLGSLAASDRDYRYGVAFTNATGGALTSVTVAFAAEQWRVGASALTNRLVCEYCITNRVMPLYQGVWWRLEALGFASPLVTNALQSAGATYVTESKAATIVRPVPAGSVLLVRWCDEDDAGNDHALGIDDFRVDWVSGGDLPDALAVGREGIKETFDELGPAAAGELPYLWRCETRADASRATGNYGSALTRLSFAGPVDANSCGGSYAFESAECGDRSAGGVVAEESSRTVSLMVRLRNMTGVPLRRLNVRYAVEKYRNGTCACQVRLLASADGVTWSAVGTGTLFAADADGLGYLPECCPALTVVEACGVVLPEAVALGDAFFLAWQIAAAEGEPSDYGQALAIDDVTVEPVLPDGCVLTLR